MTKDQVAELIEQIKEPLSPEDFLVALATKAAEWGQDQCRVPKMTDEQIWKCNSDGNGGFHICVAHQNVLEFARAIEREIGFNRANLWIKRINDAVLTEREACAKVCDERGGKKRFASSYEEGFMDGADVCAQAIRGRGGK